MKNENEAIRLAKTIVNLKNIMTLVDDHAEMFGQGAVDEIRQMIDGLIDDARKSDGYDRDIELRVTGKKLFIRQFSATEEDNNSGGIAQYIPWMDKYSFDSTEWTDDDWKEYFDELKAKSKGCGDED